MVILLMFAAWNGLTWSVLLPNFHHILLCYLSILDVTLKYRGKLEKIANFLLKFIPIICVTMFPLRHFNQCLDTLMVSASAG